MPSILLCDRAVHTDWLCRDTGLPEGVIHGREPGWPAMLRPCTPYVLGETLALRDHAILSDLAPHTVANNLTRIGAAHGGDTTLALADMLDDLRSLRPSVTQYATATADVAVARIGRFSQAVQASQQAIVDYHRATRSGHGREAARQALVQANENLNQRFRVELQAARSRMSARYRALSSQDARLAELVRHTRKVTRLDIASRVESGQLARLGRAAKYLGNGLTALDFGSRAQDIRDEYLAGGDWTRKLFIESSSFAASAGVGLGVVAAGNWLLGALLVATPAGWVLIVGGLGIATAAATTSLLSDRHARELADSTYERILAWMRQMP